ncbi:hypothetical protein KKE06_00805 [Candidatus Micrarchaeota archaeon]|nr:hypothetical protein [Candidatus Micrarchaeota archaeon]MBU1930146.1 hypothetical protein [Candidatus Micrarchaeota archaeon]
MKKVKKAHRKMQAPAWNGRLYFESFPFFSRNAKDGTATKIKKTGPKKAGTFHPIKKFRSVKVQRKKTKKIKPQRCFFESREITTKAASTNSQKRWSKKT